MLVRKGWLAASVVAVGVLLAVGCSSEPPPSPCQPLDPSEVSALIDREIAARESYAQSLARMDDLYEDAWAASQRDETGVDGATFRKLDELRSADRFDFNDGEVSRLALEYAALPSECERWLDERHEEGLTHVIRIWDTVEQIRDAVEDAEEDAAEAADTVQLAETIVRLGDERKRTLE